MAGLLGSVVGNVVEAGIQAVMGGIPVSENGSKALDLLRDGGIPVPPKSWFTPKLTEQQKTQNIYDNISVHVNGVLQVLKPCMEIKRVIEGGSCSAGTKMPAQKAKESLHYYTPQRPVKPKNERSHQLSSSMNYKKPLQLPGSTFSSSVRQQCGVKKAASRNSPTALGHRNMNSYGKDKGEIHRNEGSAALYSGRQEKLVPKARCPSSSEKSEVTSVANGSLITPIKKGKSPNRTKLSSMNQLQDQFCVTCSTHITACTKPTLAPCGHLFCYRCLPNSKFMICRECGKTFKFEEISLVFE